MNEPRHDLVAHLREQIKRNPGGYANDAKLRAIVNVIQQELRDTSGAVGETK